MGALGQGNGCAVRAGTGELDPEGPGVAGCCGPDGKQMSLQRARYRRNIGDSAKCQRRIASIGVLAKSGC